MYAGFYWGRTQPHTAKHTHAGHALDESGGAPPHPAHTTPGVGLLLALALRGDVEPAVVETGIVEKVAELNLE